MVVKPQKICCRNVHHDLQPPDFRSVSMPRTRGRACVWAQDAAKKSRRKIGGKLDREA
ncbi:MAG TPA: hypothetical protein VND94_07485 [Terriglobia bacterium]|nr:hypothetical protein [Terriglobia bacterium]